MTTDPDKSKADSILIGKDVSNSNVILDNGNTINRCEDP